MLPISDNITLFSPDPKFKVVFRVNTLTGKYNLKNFSPSQVDKRCTLFDLNTFFNQIYLSTSSLKPIRKQTITTILALLVCSLLILYGIGFWFYDLFEKFDPKSLLSICIASGTILTYALLYCYHYKISYSEIPKLRQKISQVIEYNRVLFDEVGLRWVLPENCHWIELCSASRNSYIYPIPQFPYKTSKPQKMRLSLSPTHHNSLSPEYQIMNTYSPPRLMAGKDCGSESLSCSLAQSVLQNGTSLH